MEELLKVFYNEQTKTKQHLIILMIGIELLIAITKKFLKGIKK